MHPLCLNPYWTPLHSSPLPTHLLEAVDNAGSWHQVCVGDVAPVSNLVDAPLVLVHHCVANDSKLPVLKDKEVVLLGNGLELISYAGVPPGGGGG